MSWLRDKLKENTTKNYRLLSTMHRYDTNQKEFEPLSENERIGWVLEDRHTPKNEKERRQFLANINNKIPNRLRPYAQFFFKTTSEVQDEILKKQRDEDLYNKLLGVAQEKTLQAQAAQAREAKRRPLPKIPEKLTVEPIQLPEIEKEQPEVNKPEPGSSQQTEFEGKIDFNENQQQQYKNWFDSISRDEKKLITKESDNYKKKLESQIDKIQENKKNKKGVKDFLSDEADSNRKIMAKISKIPSPNNDDFMRYKFAQRYYNTAQDLYRIYEPATPKQKQKSKLYFEKKINI